MKWSIITPSFLGPYKQAGSDRERKLIRAVNSVLNQNFAFDIEHLIVADGCEQTKALIIENFHNEIEAGQVRLLWIEKQKLFSGRVRNAGLEKARGEWIAYLDADDVFGPEHLTVIDQQLNGFDWVFFNDMVYDREGFNERTCHIKQYHCGTSNIAHRRSLKARWKEKNFYGQDDWFFINALKDESANWKKIDTPEYIVCHIPFKSGYDV